MNDVLMPIKILIIDDDTEECEMIKRAFDTAEDIDVCGVANDGIVGIEMVKSLKPDLVLLDIVMPNIDGIDVAKKITEIDSDKIPRIVMLTAIGNQNIINTAFDIGVDYYLRKPVNLMSLVQKVRMVYKDTGYNNTYNEYKSKTIIIREIVKSVGIPINLTGYKYVVQILEVMLGESLTFKEMYDIIADKNNTSNQCVEMSIRNVIRKAAATENDFYLSVFGRNRDKVPSNSIFLETLKEIIYMEIS